MTIKVEIRKRKDEKFVDVFYFENDDRQEALDFAINFNKKHTENFASTPIHLNDFLTDALIDGLTHLNTMLKVNVEKLKPFVLMSKNKVKEIYIKPLS